MKSNLYTIFVSLDGFCTMAADYMLWIETKDRALYEKALAAVEPNGWKVAKIYLPTDDLEMPDFGKCINKL